MRSQRAQCHGSAIFGKVGPGTLAKAASHIMHLRCPSPRFPHRKSTTACRGNSLSRVESRRRAVRRGGILQSASGGESIDLSRCCLLWCG